MTASPSRSARRIERRLFLRAFGRGTAACLGEGRRGDFVSGAVGFIDYLSSLAGEPQFIERTAP
jgi:hypothetical protein